jgi:hypothetical protein
MFSLYGSAGDDASSPSGNEGGGFGGGSSGVRFDNSYGSSGGVSSYFNSLNKDNSSSTLRADTISDASESDHRTMIGVGMVPLKTEYSPLFSVGRMQQACGWAGLR